MNFSQEQLDEAEKLFWTITISKFNKEQKKRIDNGEFVILGKLAAKDKNIQKLIDKFEKVEE